MTNNKQQTAVDYLVEQLFPKALSAEQYYHIQQAKEIHKQEMIKFGCLLTQAPQHIIEEAYNETYGGGNK